MDVWFDMTARAHPLVFRPVIGRLRAAGHEVDVAARDDAHPLELLERLGTPHETIGRHDGASRARKLAALVSRTARMRRGGRAGYDLAVAPGFNDLALAAALGIPEINTFDDEPATQQYGLGGRLARGS